MEGLLKLKKLKEHYEKVGLGKILKKIDKEESQIVFLNQNLEQMYDSQSKNLKDEYLKAYPRIIHGTREKINSHNKNLEKLKRDYMQAQKRLNIILGEVKVLQKMKSEHKRIWKKKVGIKKEREIEDVINMRRANG